MRRTILFATIITFLASVSGFAQDNHSFSPASLHLSWQLEDNFHQQQYQFRSTLTLLNNGNRPIPSDGWSLYFNNLSGEDQSGNFEITHINGDLFRLTPTDRFDGLVPGEVLDLDIVTGGTALNISGSPRGFYWVWDDTPEKAWNVGPFTLHPVSGPEVLNRGPNDQVPAATPQTVYEWNAAVNDLPHSELSPVFPTPVEYSRGDGQFELTRQVTVRYASPFRSEAEYLADELKSLLGEAPELTTGNLTGPGIILQQGDTPAEGYRLEITPDRILIEASQPAGLFYGIQTLKTTIPPNSYAGVQEAISVPALSVEDAPRFGYRAFMQDVSRNFRSKEQILKTLDLMSLYKLNVFHFHFNDDEGWRIEIPGLPELTEVGSQRGHTLDNRDRLVPSFGSGPESTYPGSGYYTTQDFIEILEYATKRHIRVIPEIETPGHARAAIKSMDARYHRLMEEGKTEEAWEYLIQHPQDSSQYRSVQGWDDNVIDVGMPSTYRFLEKVLDELVRMYETAGAPLDRIHMGGDEVPAGAWEHSPAVRDLIAEEEEVSSTDDLWGYFYRRVNGILRERGLSLYGWEEIGMKDALWGGESHAVADEAFAQEDVQVDVWNNVLGSGAEDLAYRLANAGYKVVLSGVSNFYFDLAYQKAFPEPGLYWGGFNGLDRPYSFIPFDYFKNSEHDLLGRPLPEDHFDEMERLSDEGRSNIVGIQSLLWGEKLITDRRQEYMLLPKLLAMAERAWAPKPAWAEGPWDSGARSAYQRAWNRFLNRAGKRELPRLDHYAGGFAYRIPTPGGIIKEGQLHANIQLPGFTIRYTSDGSTPDTDSPQYLSPVNIPEGATVKLRAFTGTGRGGRTVELSSN